MAINGGDIVTIDVERLVSSIELTMPHDLFMSSKRCIFKTPVQLFKHNEKAYIPDTFSIGPFHHGRPNLKATEPIKAKYLQELLNRLCSRNIMLRDIINSINAVGKEAREYYAGPIDYSPEEFLKILVIDGCFIIELFHKYDTMNLEEVADDPIHSVSCMLEVLSHDLILLENQVPWMVLERLFCIIMASESKDALIRLAMRFFSSIFPFLRTSRYDHLGDIKHIPDLFKKLLVSSIEVNEENISVSSRYDHLPYIKHIIDLFKKCSVSSTEANEENILISGWEHIPSATRLAEAGIKFKKGTSNNILDIKFTNGVLKIPPITIHEETETFFRNLISFEQCYPNSDDMITSYAILLDNLINTAKDVEILCENKILENWLTPEDAAQFLNKLYNDSFIRRYNYENLCKQVNQYCQKRWPRWRAMLVRNYFNTPWALLSTLAAVVLLILSFVQTWYGVKG